MILSANCLGQEAAVGCERNKFAERQFNKSEVEGLVKLFFLDNLKRLKNKSEILLTRNR
jgi:hypothetical protein